MTYLLILWMGLQTGQVTEVAFTSEEKCQEALASLVEEGSIDAVVMCTEK